jgi:hypothetical protein
MQTTLCPGDTCFDSLCCQQLVCHDLKAVCCSHVLSSTIVFSDRICTLNTCCTAALSALPAPLLPDAAALIDLI